MTMTMTVTRGKAICNLKAIPTIGMSGPRLHVGESYPANPLSR
jgi:hypothetical protein